MEFIKFDLATGSIKGDPGGVWIKIIQRPRSYNRYSRVNKLYVIDCNMIYRSGQPLLQKSRNKRNLFSLDTLKMF